MCTVLLPPGVKPTAVNKYIISYRIIYHIIPSRIYLPIVLFGCETWSVTLREVHRPRVFENRVLTEICGAERGVKEIV